MFLSFSYIFFNIPMYMESKTWLIDIGNSTIQYVALTNEPNNEVISLSTDLVTPELIQERFHHSCCYVSTVVPKVIPWFDSVSSSTVRFASCETVQLLKVNLDKPEELGADRLINALGAYKTYGGPCLIIDSGTALTCCYVDGQGVYQGGSIFPGMRICSSSLHEKTAKLPLVWVEPTAVLQGKTTKEAIEIGLYEGFLGALKHMIQRYRQDVADIKVIGTGQGLGVFVDQLDMDVYDERLIFKGLEVWRSL
jgi:pantothenate kinase type III